MISCAFLMTACGIFGDNADSGNSGNNIDNGNVKSATKDAFDSALAINGEGVSMLGQSVNITSAGTYYFKYSVEEEIPSTHNGRVTFNLSGSFTEEGTITKIEVYDLSKTLVKTIESPTSTTNHGSWVIVSKNSDENLHKVGTYYLKIDFAKTGSFLASFKSSSFN